MIWLLIGAALGCLHYLLFQRKAAPEGRLLPDLAVAALLGAITYGSLLWLAAAVFF